MKVGKYLHVFKVFSYFSMYKKLKDFFMRYINYYLKAFKIDRKVVYSYVVGKYIIIHDDIVFKPIIKVLKSLWLFMN